MAAVEIPLTRPFFAREEMDAIGRPLDSGWVTQGPEVNAFEREFAQHVGAAHACAVANGTAALHLALLGVHVEPLDEVITVSHSFIATANAIRFVGATPVFVDIDPRTYNLDPGLLQGALSSRTKAILCVHQLGMPADLAAVQEFAANHGLSVIEDAACAAGSTVRIDGSWQAIGKPHSDAACFSFHPRKVLTTGDGGMLTTQDGELAARWRRLRNHGMEVMGATRRYTELGYNYRMTDMQAALGRVQLGRLSGFVAQRRALAERYAGLLADLQGVAPPFEPAGARSNFQSYCIRLPEGTDVEQVRNRMGADAIATGAGVTCAHREPAYSEANHRAGSDLSHGERAQDQCMLLPLFHQLTADDQQRVVGSLAAALRAQGRC